VKATYFLGTQLLGTSVIPRWSATELLSHSIAYLCPVCGELWGRVWIEGAEWVPIRSGCPKHPWPSRPGGSFIPPWDFPAESLPLPALRREFLIRFQETFPNVPPRLP
jgi:hypothetical protein